jgi:microcystin-dependent protein
MMLNDECNMATKVIGAIIPYATAAVPDGCLECNGATYLRTDYPALYAALHANYKTDADHFVVPDLRNRVMVGKAVAGWGGTTRTMKDAFGAETHTLQITEMPAHNHSAKIGSTSGGTTFIDGASGSQAGTGSTSINNTGGGGAHNNMQPSHVVGFCIVAVA